jgi:hypothetical protein
MEVYANFGANMKRLLWAVNQQFGKPVNVNTPAETINARDVWRVSIGWTTDFASRSPAPDGSMIKELWPAPFSLQTFPFEGYQQPPNMVQDSDAPVAWIASDMLVKRASADAIRHPSNKLRDAFSAQTAQAFIAEFEQRCEQAEMADNGLDQQDVTWDYGLEDGADWGGGSIFAQNHDV